MSTSKYFAQYPSFPSGSSIPIADIPTLYLAKLQAGSDEESLRLYEACRQHGFMLLDLRNSVQGEALLEDGERMFALLEATLTLGQDTLNRYACDPPRSL
jgi:hypothetical protein